MYKMPCVLHKAFNKKNLKFAIEGSVQNSPILQNKPKVDCMAMRQMLLKRTKNQEGKNIEHKAAGTIKPASLKLTYFQ